MTPAPQRSLERLFEISLLGMVASGYFAIATSGYLDGPTLTLMGFAIVVRAFLIRGFGRIPFSNAVVNALTLAYIGFYPIDYLFLSRDFLTSTIHLVFFLAITKILTARTDRDHAYVKVIAFLELLAASLLSASLSFFVFLTLFLIFAVATFATGEIRRAGRQPIRVVRSGLRRMPLRLTFITIFISLGILSITGGLFFLLPRTARAAFQHFGSHRYHLPGFSSQITLGQIGEIKRESATVMHVRFLSAKQSATPPANLKWRGAALGQFDGRRWFNQSQVKDETIQLERAGLLRLIDEGHRPSRESQRLSYEVQVKDMGSDALFFAGIPEFLSIGAPLVRRSSSDSFRVPFASPGGLSYVAHSYLEHPDVGPLVPPAPLPLILRQEYLQIPNLDPRIPRLAREWTGGAVTPELQALAVERHLRQDFGYTLTLLSSEVADPLAHFLFERRKGHCEYFASSMAVILRTLGIPSRVVTGFQSGIYNPISGRQLIRTSDAHSWVEAWLPRRGWTTFDPTPPDPGGGGMSLWTRMALYLDAAETFWQDWVLNYDFDHQMMLATRVQNSRTGTSWMEAFGAGFNRWRSAGGEFLKHYGAPLAAALIFIALAIIYGPTLRKAWLMRQRLRKVQRGVVETSDATLLYSRMLRVLERRGIEKPAWVTANEFVRLLPPSELSPIVDDLTTHYYDLRFGGNRDAGPRMITLLEQLERL